MVAGVSIQAAVLFVDIARSTELRRLKGDQAANVTISELLKLIAELVVTEHGEVVKSDGDDLIAVFCSPSQATTQAALVAIQAQQLAADAALSLYAGFHLGDIGYHQTMGRRDIQGIAVNMAARLHKLVADEPGAIYLAEEVLPALSPALREQVSIYGRRLLKGIGEVQVCRLEWRGQQTALPTQYAPTDNRGAAYSLLVRCGSFEYRRQSQDPELVVGRSRSQAQLILEEAVVSSRHLVFGNTAGRWYVRDVSRNGSWLRDGSATGGIEHLFKGESLLLPERGEICLGRAFSADPEGRLTLHFETQSL